MSNVGQAFDTIYENMVVNQCGAHDPSSSVITWEYNENNTLPLCIRKCFVKLKGDIKTSGLDTEYCDHHIFFCSILC